MHRRRSQRHRGVISGWTPKHKAHSKHGQLSARHSIPNPGGVEENSPGSGEPLSRDHAVGKEVIAQQIFPICAE